MESTGVYWKPVFYVLEGSLTCLLVNAAHVKQVPGRKTDVQDCVWIAQLLEHGLLRGSFVPPAPIRDLRDLTRHRRGLQQERTRAANRLHKLLQDAGIKLASVASNILGASGRAMLEALVGGTTDAAILADLAKGRLRQKLPALREALAGRFRDHHAFLASQLLAHVDYLDEAITMVSERIDHVLAPFAEERGLSIRELTLRRAWHSLHGVRPAGLSPSTAASNSASGTLAMRRAVTFCSRERPASRAAGRLLVRATPISGVLIRRRRNGPEELPVATELRVISCGQDTLAEPSQ
jgi:transposase